MSGDILQRSGSVNPVAQGAELLTAGAPQIIEQLNEAERRFRVMFYDGPDTPGTLAHEAALAYVAGLHSLGPENVPGLEGAWRQAAE